MPQSAADKSLTIIRQSADIMRGCFTRMPLDARTAETFSPAFQKRALAPEGVRRDVYVK